MTITARFGKKLKVPSIFHIKRQLLHFWLKDQLAKEEAERQKAIGTDTTRMDRIAARVSSLHIRLKGSDMLCDR